MPVLRGSPGAPDRVFAALDDDDYGARSRPGRARSSAPARADADVLHLHHLTPLNEAAARVVPDVPVVGHLHGTELLMLERIAAGAPRLDARRGVGGADVRAGPRLRAAGRATPPRARARGRSAGVDPDRASVVPNGFDPERFSPAPVDRARFWRRAARRASRTAGGPGEAPGSVAYDEPTLAALADGRVLLYVGRFTEVKRLPLLIEAFARRAGALRRRRALVLVGGHPGEWEGEHPAERRARSAPATSSSPAGTTTRSCPTSQRGRRPRPGLGQRAVRPGAGRGHGLRAAAIAVDRGGPAEIVDDGRDRLAGRARRRARARRRDRGRGRPRRGAGSAATPR